MREGKVRVYYPVVKVVVSPEERPVVFFGLCRAQRHARRLAVNAVLDYPSPFGNTEVRRRISVFRIVVIDDVQAAELRRVILALVVIGAEPHLAGRVVSGGLGIGHVRLPVAPLPDGRAELRAVGYHLELVLPAVVKRHGEYRFIDELHRAEIVIYPEKGHVRPLDARHVAVAVLVHAEEDARARRARRRVVVHGDRCPYYAVVKSVVAVKHRHVERVHFARRRQRVIPLCLFVNTSVHHPPAARLREREARERVFHVIVGPDVRVIELHRVVGPRHHVGPEVHPARYHVRVVIDLDVRVCQGLGRVHHIYRQLVRFRVHADIESVGIIERRHHVHARHLLEHGKVAGHLVEFELAYGGPRHVAVARVVHLEVDARAGCQALPEDLVPLELECRLDRTVGKEVVILEFRPLIQSRVFGRGAERGHFLLQVFPAFHKPSAGFVQETGSVEPFVNTVFVVVKDGPLVELDRLLHALVLVRAQPDLAGRVTGVLGRHDGAAREVRYLRGNAFVLYSHGKFILAAVTKAGVIVRGKLFYDARGYLVHAQFGPFGLDHVAVVR